jgi:hypothetical protein
MRIIAGTGRARDEENPSIEKINHEFLKIFLTSCILGSN